MKVEYDFKGNRKIVEIDNNETEAEKREREYVLYTYLEKSPVENTSGTKRIPKSARTTYIADAKKFFKRVLDKGLIVSEKPINPFNINKQNIDFLKNILDNVWKVESYKEIDSSISSNAPRAFLQHLIDFVENFTTPQIFWLNISEKEEYWKEQYPLDKWQLGKNNDMIRYGYRDNVKNGDIAIFCFTDDIKAIRYIGRVYKIDEYVYFNMLLKIEKGFDSQEIRNMNDLENYPPQGGFSKMGNQQIALELVIKCFENGQSQQNMTTNQNLEKQENKPVTNTDSTKGENMTIPPLNQILYGPPGTGKTYSTIDKALEILGYAESNDNGKTILNYDKIKQELQGIANNQKGIGLDLENLNSKNDRKLAKLLFDYYSNPEQGQIEFVTFHQSFSYEEFVEGIKPNTDNPENMIYEPKAGIFKQICIKAQENLRQANINDGQIDAGEVFDRYAEKVQEKLAKEEVISFGKNNVKVVGVVDFKNNANAGLRCTTSSGKTPIWITRAMVLRDYDNYKNGTIKEAKDIVSNHTGKKHAQSWWYLDFYAELKEFEESSNIQAKKISKKPYILIIDEINRGNISKILGELITLIELSKRIGASDEEKARGIGDESLEVALPYSNDEFGVPSNLYIIGTMNTADRSIALLDTALRRRFEFVEMMPQWDNEHISTSCEGVNLQELLKTMNERIEFLLDREHAIGHSFFIEVKSLNDLQKVFKNNIIPLLQEYFYDDYAKIDAVLNHNGMVEIIETKVLKLFPKKDVDLDLEDKKIYKIKSFEKEEEKKFWSNPQTYKSIYLDKNE